MTRGQKHTKIILASGLRWLPRNSGLDEAIVTNNTAGSVTAELVVGNTIVETLLVASLPYPAILGNELAIVPVNRSTTWTALYHNHS